MASPNGTHVPSPSAPHVALLPDAPELPALLDLADEFFLDLRTVPEWDDDDPYVLPGVLGDGTALAAGERLLALIRASRAGSTTLPVLYGPDGAYEYCPLVAVRPDPADLAVLGRALDLCKAARGPDLPAEYRDLADVLDQLKTLRHPNQPAPTDVLAPLIQLHSLLAHPPDDDVRVLAARLANPHPVVLRLTELDSYHRFATRVNGVLTGGNRLARWTY
ncbi:MAG TPA: hypothetical protein VK506_05320 [Conexibacter sp.]|nr:hypothetical protein [Conexibacter sp.]